ncbi:Myb/SANT-like domain [Dillenia turbinata]|uniref:Myb/SANT-like domain n=1 Tax=Dillenia turbinata TaxID=194707 RepID=A0AAN8VZ22_9MAGN
MQAMELDRKGLSWYGDQGGRGRDFTCVGESGLVLQLLVARISLIVFAKGFEDLAEGFESRLLNVLDEMEATNSQKSKKLVSGGHQNESYSISGKDVMPDLVQDVETVDVIDASSVQCGASLEDHMRWTAEMDSCLSKILVEQVRLGNKSKSDKELKPAAYVAAVAGLNERFQQEFTRDNVIYWIKTWKKLYSVMRELLTHSGFCWDGTQKMINADAGLLQGRVIQNIDDLGILFDNDNVSEISANHDEAEKHMSTNNEDEDYVSHNRSNNVKERGKCIIWTHEMDFFLTQTLVEQVKMGNKVDKILKPAAYTAAVRALNENFGLDMNKVHIKSRLKTWKKLYALVKELLAHNGFEWDEKQKMVVATASSWNDYIKSHPDAKRLRAKSIPNYDGLRIIIDNEKGGPASPRKSAKVYVNSTTKTKARECVQACIQTTPDNEKAYHDGTRGSALQTSTRSKAYHDGTRGSAPRTSTRSSFPSWPKQASRKRHAAEAILEVLSTMSANIGRIADALTENNHCLDELFEMVQKIPGFDDDLIIEACEYLSSDEKRARMFLNLDDRLRKMWLLKRLRSNSS